MVPVRHGAARPARHFGRERSGRAGPPTVRPSTSTEPGRASCRPADAGGRGASRAARHPDELEPVHAVEF